MEVQSRYTQNQFTKEFQKYIEVGKKHKYIMDKVEEKFYHDKNSFQNSYEIKEFIEKHLKNEIYPDQSDLYSTARLKQGLSFPIGVNIDCKASHNTPHKIYNNEPIAESSLVKVDFGLHDTGRIIDSARTMTKNDLYKPLQNASLDALENAIKMSGPDVLLCEIGETIEEIVKSYEITVSRETHTIVPVFDLSGHNLSIYRVHNNKAVPNVKFPTYRERMTVDEVFAIEPFVTWGNNRVEYLKKENDAKDFKNSNHYTIYWNRIDSLQQHFKQQVIVADENGNETINSLKDPMKELLKNIYKTNYTLPFSPYDYEQYDPKIYSYYNNSYLEEAPVIVTQHPCAQYEKTIGITEKGFVEF